MGLQYLVHRRYRYALGPALELDFEARSTLRQRARTPVPRDHYRVHLAVELEPVARQLDLLHYLGWPQPQHQGCKRDLSLLLLPVLHGLRDPLPQVQDASEVDDPEAVGLVPDVDDRYEGGLLAQRDSTSRSRSTILSIKTPLIK